MKWRLLSLGASIVAGAVLTGLSCDGGPKSPTAAVDVQGTGSQRLQASVCRQLVRANEEGRVQLQKVLVQVPQKALSTDRELTISMVTEAELTQRGIPVPDPEAVYVELGPTGTVFAKPVTVQLPWPASAGEGSELAVRCLNQATGTFEPVAIVRTDAASRLVFVEVTHFSLYTVTVDTDRKVFRGRLLRAGNTLGVQLYLASLDTVRLPEAVGDATGDINAYATFGQYIAMRPSLVSTTIHLYLTSGGSSWTAVSRAVDSVAVTIQATMQTSPTDFALTAVPMWGNRWTRQITRVDGERALVRVLSGEPVVVYFDAQNIGPSKRYSVYATYDISYFASYTDQLYPGRAKTWTKSFFLTDEAGDKFSTANTGLLTDDASRLDYNYNNIIDDFDPPLARRTISGTVRGAGGVLVALSGDSTAQRIVANGGTYSFSVRAGRTYTVRATKTRYTFTPAEQTVPAIAADQTINFVGTLTTHTLSGTVSGADGVTVRLFRGSTTTDQVVARDGQGYSFTISEGGPYKIKPSKVGYVFVPDSTVYPSVTANQTQDFRASRRTWILSGTVSGLLDSAVVALTGGDQSLSARVGPDGRYSFRVPEGGTYTVTPTRAGFTFRPPSRQFAQVAGNMTGDFQANLGSAPVANAGPDQSVQPGATVRLDGRASTVAAGRTINYRWTPPDGITRSGWLTERPTFTAPASGRLVFSLVVSDQQTLSAPDTVIVTVTGQSNTPPVAEAGPDQSVTVGTLVTLDGRRSSDVNGDSLRYGWQPVGNAANLTRPTTARPTFTPTGVGQYRFVLVVNDGQADSRPDTVLITVVQSSSGTSSGTSSNAAPVANAGPDLTVRAGVRFVLDGSASHDPEGKPLTYRWTAPNSPNVGLYPVSGVRQAFMVTAPGPYRFTLVVNDGTQDSAPDGVVVTARGTNTVPVADAGPDQRVPVGALVHLDATTSTDADGDSLTYHWVLASLSHPWVRQAAHVDLNLSNPARPSFTPTAPGEYRFLLTVSDGMADSAPDSVLVTAANQPPVANAGPDQTVTVGTTVRLDGSASRDPDGQPLTYKWTALDGVVLSSATVVRPTFTASAPGTYRISLVVNDGQANSAPDTVIVTVTPLNAPPVANAGMDQTVQLGATVQLDGSASRDADGQTLTYQWTPPTGSSVSNRAIARPTFAPTTVGTYKFRLVVNDGLANSAPDSVVVTVTRRNIPPVAEAGPDQTVELGATVQLDGSASRDADGQTLTYQWTPQTGTTLSNPTIAHPTFTPTAVGIYRFRLVVNDGLANSNPDTVAVTVQPPASSSPTLTATLPGGATMEFVWIAPGTFTMGDAEYGEMGTPHQVTLTQGYSLAKTELTQGQWQAVMGTAPWLGQSYVQESPSNPAVFVSWDDVQSLVHALNQAAGDSLYRLPTEAEWEYACRAGTTTRWSFGDSESEVGQYAWYYSNTYGLELTWAQPVGTKLPNPWGLYDMHGNVWEWVQDWSDLYGGGAQSDPPGPVTGSTRVVRSGGFMNDASRMWSARRDWFAPDYRGNGVGARLLRMAEPARANTPPQANAGPDQTVDVGATVQLDGSASTDADGNALTYRWSAPAGVTLSSTTVAAPAFTASAAGTYRLTLVVNDGTVDSPSDEVVVTVRPGSSGDPTLTATLPGGATMEFVWIAPGTFTMGDADLGDTPHQVTLTKGYYLARTELTQGQWQAVMGTTPWSGDGCVPAAAGNPAADISWDDVQGLVAALNQAARESLYRLPTEAEWEYACRAGTTTAWSFGDDEGQLGRYAWYMDNTWYVGLTWVQPVGGKLANPWGLYDMHGNVEEWVQDWYDSYGSGAQTDPPGPAAGSRRVVRGGGIGFEAPFTRSAFRYYYPPYDGSFIIGARLLRTR